MAIYGGFQVRSSAVSAESVTMAFKIDSGETGDMFQGDLIAVNTDGAVSAAVADGDLAVAGVFVGCNYTDSEGERVYANHYDVTITRNDNVAFVNVNPFQIYSVRVGTGGTEGTITQASIGMSLDIDGTNAGNATTGLSGQMAKTGTESASARVRVVGVTNLDTIDPYTQAPDTPYTHALCIIDPATSLWTGVGR